MLQGYFIIVCIYLYIVVDLIYVFKILKLLNSFMKELDALPSS